MVELTYPQAFLLAIPVVPVLLRLRARRRVLFALQLAIAALGLAVLAQPKVGLRERGADVVLVIDRSLSMPAGAAARAAEVAELVAQARGRGDRLGIITFGDGALVQMVPSATDIYAPDPKETPPNASDLRKGVETALALIPTDRGGRIFVLSDGEHTGPSPIPAAREAASRGVPVDYRLFGRPEESDLAVERIALPQKVSSGEPFQFSAIVRAEQPTTADYVLLRGDEVLAKGRGRFVPGANRLVFRDLLVGRGLCEYHLKLLPTSDARPENNSGRGVVEVVNAPALLVVNASGQEDSLAAALKKAKIPVKVLSEDRATLDLDTLHGFRGVILENVPGSKLGRAGMAALATFVDTLGGGLLVTGGPRSFANGGYLKSPLDPLLPVSMEIRQEHRKVGIALAIALDRSGSMSVSVAGGMKKMDLANLGTAAAVEMLSPNDSVAVIAVDSLAHLIQELTPCDNPVAITSRVKRIESMGGGIFIFDALLAAGKQLEWARQLTKHILLFADAADSEEPREYKDLLARFRTMNITVSVIGLGTERDQDAELLKDIARRGEGTIQFTNDPHDLPRLFAQDTVTVTRSSFIEEPTPLKSLPDLLLVAKDRYADVPAAGGYNLTYLRPRASQGLVTQDEYAAPALAFWQHGLGRVAAFTPEADGKFTGALAGWKSYGDFLVTLGRYLLGEDEPESVQAEMSLQAGEGVLAVEVDPEKPLALSSSPVALVLPPTAQQPPEPVAVPLEWVGPTRLEGRFPVKHVGTYRAAVQVGKSQVVKVNPVAVPYSPEFAPRPDQMSGKETLKLLARITGGKERLSVEDVFTTRGIAPRRTLRDIALPLVLGLLVLLVVEIAERRLTLLTTFARAVADGAAAALAAARKAAPAVRLPRRKPKAAPTPTAAPAQEPVEVAPAAPPPREKPPPRTAPPPRPAEDAMEGALRRVKRRHRAPP